MDRKVVESFKNMLSGMQPVHWVQQECSTKRKIWLNDARVGGLYSTTLKVHTDLVSTRVEEVAQADYVAVIQLPHNLQLTVLKR